MDERVQQAGLPRDVFLEYNVKFKLFRGYVTWYTDAAQQTRGSLVEGATELARVDRETVGATGLFYFCLADRFEGET